MKPTTSNNAFLKPINSSLGTDCLAWLKWFAKRGVLLIFVFGLLVILQIASLEIPNRYSLFPLYGFYSVGLLLVAVLSIYLVASQQGVFLSALRSFARKPKTKKIKEVPAVLLIIRRREIKKPKSKSVSVR